MPFLPCDKGIFALVQFRGVPLDCEGMNQSVLRGIRISHPFDIQISPAATRNLTRASVIRPGGRQAGVTSSFSYVCMERCPFCAVEYTSLRDQTDQANQT